MQSPAAVHQRVRKRFKMSAVISTWGFIGIKDQSLGCPEMTSIQISLLPFFGSNGRASLILLHRASRLASAMAFFIPAN
jgi:hypothetical protein